MWVPPAGSWAVGAAAAAPSLSLGGNDCCLPAEGVGTGAGRLRAPEGSGLRIRAACLVTASTRLGDVSLLQGLSFCHFQVLASTHTYLFLEIRRALG